MSWRTCASSPPAEVLAAMAEPGAFSATLPEAVDFFVKHARPDSGTITVEDAAKMFLEAKKGLKRSRAYLRGCKKTYYLPFACAFPGRVPSDIGQGEAGMRAEEDFLRRLLDR